jgi:hypothetical protein
MSRHSSLPFSGAFVSVCNLTWADIPGCAAFSSIHSGIGWLVERNMNQPRLQMAVSEIQWIGRSATDRE